MRLRSMLAAVCLALPACEHAQPFGAAGQEPNQPFSAAFPRQLTFNALGDVQPAWLPGDSGISYSLSVGAPNGNHCLGILPPDGGHLTATICATSPADVDSTIALWLPAPGPQGLLAYRRDASAVGAVAPSSSQLVLATMGAPDRGSVLVGFPYTGPDSVLVGGLEDLRWLSSGTLVYLAGALTFTTPPLPVDTLFTPLEIVRLDLVGDSARLAVVPGTAGATSLATDSGALYYTLAGDSRVYRLAAGAGAPTVWYDFGAAGAASDVQVSGNVLVALVGSTLYAAHIGAGLPAPLILPPSLAVSNIALSRAGNFVVVEGSLGGAPDLWLVETP